MDNLISSLHSLQSAILADALRFLASPLLVIFDSEGRSAAVDPKEMKYTLQWFYSPEQGEPTHFLEVCECCRYQPDDILDKVDWASSIRREVRAHYAQGDIREDRIVWKKQYEKVGNWNMAPRGLIRMKFIEPHLFALETPTECLYKPLLKEMNS